MKKILYTLPLIVLALSLIIHNGCKQDDEVVTPIVDENIDKESKTSKNMVEIVKVLTDANSYSNLYNNNISPSSTCPDYYFDGSFYSALVVNYGEFPGCLAADNIRRTGKYILTAHVFPENDSVYTNLSFVDFRIYKAAALGDTNIKFNGTLNISTKKTSGSIHNFHATGEAVIITFDGNTKTINLSGTNGINGTVNYNTTNIVTDDSYSLYGNVGITDGVNFNISAAQSSALQLLGNCRYPLTGIAKISGNGNTECDFSPNSGACDAIVKLTKASTSRNIDLSNINY